MHIYKSIHGVGWGGEWGRGCGVSGLWGVLAENMQPLVHQLPCTLEVRSMTLSSTARSATPDQLIYRKRSTSLPLLL